MKNPEPRTDMCAVRGMLFQIKKVLLRLGHAGEGMIQVDRDDAGGDIFHGSTRSLLSPSPVPEPLPGKETPALFAAFFGIEQRGHL